MRGRRRQQQQHQFLQRLRLLLLLLPLVILLLTSVVHGQILEVTSGSFMDNRDFAFCYQALQVSDTNGDNEVDKEEYVEFSRFLSPPGLLDGIVSFDELPLEYRSSFISTACLCSIPAFGGTSLAISDYTDSATVSQEDRCCFGVDAHIRVPTSSSSNSSNNPVSTLSSIDRAYLYAACAYTDSAAEIVLKENEENENNDTPVVPAPSPPTPAPVPETPRPTTSTPTTAAPITAAVTAAPSTVAPVVTTAAPITEAPITTVPPVVTTAAPTTVVATNAPTTAAPTPATAKTAMPTPAPLLVPAHVTYSIAVENDDNDNDEVVEGINTNGTINTNSSSISNSSAAIMNNEDDDDDDNAELLAVVSYLSDLQVALNRLAPVVARETFDGESENCVRRKRQLIQEEEEDSQQQRPLLRRKTTQQHKKGRRSLQKQQIHCDDVQVKVQLPTKFGSVSDMGKYSS